MRSLFRLGKERLAAQFSQTLVLMAVGSVLAAWVGLAVIFYGAQLRSIAKIQEASARQVSNLIRDYVGAAERQLAVFAASESLGLLPADRTHDAIGNLLLNASPTFSELSVLDAGGGELAKVSRLHTYLPAELADRSATAAFAAAHSGATFRSDVFVSPGSGALSMTLSLPLAGGKALVAELNVTSLWMDMASTRIGETGYVYLVDAWGRFIAFQEPSAVLQRYGEDMKGMPPVARFLDSARRSAAAGSAGPARAATDIDLDRYRGLKGQEVFGLHMAVPGSDWAVIAEIPVREALSDFRRLQVYLAIVAFLAATLAGIVGAVAARRYARPVAALIEAARRLEAGDSGDITLDLGRADELGILARAFRSMQDSLRVRSADLARRLGELTEAKAELQRSERKFRAVFDQTFELLGILDPAGRLVEANEISMSLIDAAREDVVGRPFWETPWWSFLPDQARKVQAAVRRAAAGSLERFETRHIDREGKAFEVDFSLKPVRDGAGSVVLLVAEGRDITGRKAAEEGVRASLREKEVLLKEIHHRVKNNLQIIMSLLNLQATRIADPEIVRLYEESISRVRTMAQVHELLYQSPNLSGIDLSEQLRLVAEDLHNAYRHRLGDVRLSFEAEPVELAIELALPCGLIVNEALTNAFKYAFPPEARQGGEVSVRVSARGAEVEIEIADDGVGIPPGIELGVSEGIGLSLIHLLVAQLRGKVELDRSAGTRYRIPFPRPEKP